ncbi:MAG TPA: hypothetical protein VHX59_09025 [Mycobacteriales bacterium]|nr:hypothetical protein [Mycobacteriales bacterium]
MAEQDLAETIDRQDDRMRQPSQQPDLARSELAGPAAMSPVSTIRSAARTAGSASTASGAGSTP